MNREDEQEIVNANTLEDQDDEALPFAVSDYMYDLELDNNSSDDFGIEQEHSHMCTMVKHP